METADLYAALGVDHHASLDEIKRTYRLLARQYHPDLHVGDLTAEARMKTINAAAAILCDPQQRAAYDRTRAAQNTAAAQWAHLRTAGYPGHDVSVTITIDPALAQHGGRYTISQFSSPDGQIQPIILTIPPGTVAGLRICIPGAGGPGYHSIQRGDLIVVIAIAARPVAAYREAVTPSSLFDSLTCWLRGVLR